MKRAYNILTTQDKKVCSAFNICLFKLSSSLFFLSCLLFPYLSYSADLFEVPLPTTSGGEWEIQADSLVSLENGTLFEARGNVIVQNDENILEADFARYYTTTGWIFIQGNVVVKLGRDQLSASEAEINLHDLTGFLRDGIVLMDANHLYVSGEYVKKHHGDTYSFNNASITSCDPSSPLWQVNAGSAIIELDGSATLTGVNMRFAFLTTPSVPYASFPLEKTRKTGFLTPKPGYSSTLGLHITTPFYWAISEERDLTIAPTYYQKTGTMASLTYRSYTDINDKTWLGLNYLMSDLLFEELLFGESAQHHKDRFWIRGMLDGEILSTSWHYKLNIDYVSDTSFLQDYKSTDYGYNDTINEVYNYFGRDFAQAYKDRVSEGYIYRKWTNTLFTAGFKYSQDPKYGDTVPLNENTTVQVPAQANFYLMPINLLSFMQIDGMAETSYNYRHSGISGARTNIQPRLSIPLNLGVISLLPQITLVQRNYFSSTQDLTDAPLEESKINDLFDNSTAFTLDVKSMLQASRIWDLNKDSPLNSTKENIGKSQYTSLQHLLEPSFTYNFTPSIDQEALPFYDSEDRMLPQSEISFTLRNALVARKHSIVASQGTQNSTEEAQVQTSFEPVLNLSLTASYNFEEERRTNYLDKFPRRPMRDFEIRSQFYPFGMNWSSYTTISAYGDGITRFDLSTNIPLFALERFITWSTALSYRNTMYDYQNIVQYATSDDALNLSKEVTLFKNNLSLKPFESIKIDLGLYRDLNDKNSYEIATRLHYYHDCFEIGIKYTYSPADQSVGFVFSIPGLL